MAVFLPLIFLGGMSGIMFKQLAFIVGFSQIFALTIGLTLVPVLCAKYLRVRPPDAKRHPFMAGIIRISGARWMAGRSLPARIRWSLNRKTSLFSHAALRRKPVSDPVHRRRDDARGRRERVEKSTWNCRREQIEITKLAGRIESIIKREVPEMEHILVEVGGGGFMSGSTTHTAEFTVQLKSKAERKRSSQEIVNALRPKLNLPG